MNFGTLAGLALTAAIALPSVVLAQADPSATLITGARIFDGTSETLIEGQDVLIEDGKFAEIGAGLTAPDGATVIDAGGRVMSPGLIFMHEHLAQQLSSPALYFLDDRYKAIYSTTVAKEYIMNGITSVRDAAGNVFGLKAAIDQGIVPGPRIYASGTMIAQTGGHSDHRLPTQPSVLMGGSYDPLVGQGDFAVVNGVPDVLLATRENLRMGASQIKIAVGGGSGSISDPLEVTEFTAEEIKAAVDAATDYGTYVMAHVYNTHGIRRAVDNGVKSIEHANLIDEETLQYMKDNDVWLSPQVSVYTFIPAGFNEGQAAKHRQAFAGIDTMFAAAKKIGFENIVMGSDIISDAEAIKDITKEFTFRAQWFTPVEIMRMATSKGGELLGHSGPMNRYPGKLGVIEVGAHADLLLIDGNPLEDVAVMADPKANFDLIMKGGVIYKNRLE